MQRAQTYSWILVLYFVTNYPVFNLPAINVDLDLSLGISLYPEKISEIIFAF